MADLNLIGYRAWRDAEAAGWHDRETGEIDRLCTNLALVHSEVSEALETLRSYGTESWVEGNDKPEGWGPELADIVIRVAELAHATDVDLTKHVESKMAYNRRRADVPARAGGKAV